MKKTGRKLIQALPDLPRSRYGIFAGTNRFSEWREVLRSLMTGGDPALEEAITGYERRFAETAGVKYAFSFGAGRMALYSILEALGIGAGDEVVIPAFTCVVVPNAMIYRGARPVYADIDPRTFNVDVAAVESLIGPRTRALYAQHTFGVPCDVEGLRELGRRYGLPVIEDCGHALGAVYRKRPAGSLSDVAYFTTDHSKVINTHLGGVAVTGDPKLAERLRAIQGKTPFLGGGAHRRLLRSFLMEYFLFAPGLLWIGRPLHMALAKAGFLFYFTDELKTALPTEYPYPCRLSAQQARIGLSQLALLPENLAHRRSIARWLEGEIGWYGMDDEELDNSAWLRYSFLVKDRDAFLRRFASRFDLAVWFTSVVGGRNSDLGAVHYREGSCPAAEFAARHIVNFPTHMRVPAEAIRREVGKNIGWIRTQILRPEDAFGLRDARLRLRKDGYAS